MSEHHNEWPPRVRASVTQAVLEPGSLTGAVADALDDVRLESLEPVNLTYVAGAGNDRIVALQLFELACARSAIDDEVRRLRRLQVERTS